VGGQKLQHVQPLFKSGRAILAVVGVVLKRHRFSSCDAPGRSACGDGAL